MQTITYSRANRGIINVIIKNAIIFSNIHSIYKILGILFLGLTLSQGVSGEPEREPDIPRDNVSPINKMYNILLIGNL
jgi:hypothetical protein